MHLFMTVCVNAFINTVTRRDQQQRRAVARRCSGRLPSSPPSFPFYPKWNANRRSWSQAGTLGRGELTPRGGSGGGSSAGGGGVLS